ncbi:MAG: TIM barrel protein [Neomegalonema sp.]|nr:TIM barrel protein [Neomegalonema sp.]
MPRFAANLSMLFADLPFRARFEAAAEAGFRAVEYQFPYSYDPKEIATELARLGLEQVLFNTPPGEWDEGERGLAAIPGREAEFQYSFERALNFAEILKPRCLNVMAGAVDPREFSLDACHATLIDNLRHACDRAAEKVPGLVLTLEPLSTREHPGAILTFVGQTLAIIEQVGRRNLKLQLDLYHTQIMEGDLAMKLRHLHKQIGHIQIAGAPDRHEPSLSEVNYPYLFRLIDELGYQGWVGCEYRPKGKTLDGLSWLAATPNKG